MNRAGDEGVGDLGPGARLWAAPLHRMPVEMQPLIFGGVVRLPAGAAGGAVEGKDDGDRRQSSEYPACHRALPRLRGCRTGLTGRIRLPVAQAPERDRKNVV